MGNLFSRKRDEEVMVEDHKVLENQANVDDTDGASCTGEEVR